MIETRYSLVLVTAPAAEPVTTAEAKSHSRVDISDDDTLIGNLIIAARQACEQEIGQAMITQTWRLTLEEWPDEIIVPMPPLISVTTLKYYNTSGTLTTLSASDYSVDTDSRPGRISPAYGEAWPALRGVYNAVQLTYTAGYGASASSVPEVFKLAIKMLVAHWYENREQTLAGSLSEIPRGVSALLMSQWHGSY